MDIKRFLSKPHLFVCWFALSAASLTVSWHIEPYLFAYLTLAAAGISLVLFGSVRQHRNIFDFKLWNDENPVPIRHEQIKP
jgi:hypothetical protein